MNEPTSISKKKYQQKSPESAMERNLQWDKQGGPLPVINGVITPIHGLIDGYL